MNFSIFESAACNSRKIRKILLFLIPFLYVAVLCNSVTNELFWSDDSEEMYFVRTMSFSRLVFGFDVFGYFRPIKNLLWISFSRTEPFGIEWCHVIAIAIGILSFYPVLALCRRILGNEWKALAAAAVWLFSPTLVSSVAWLSCLNIRIMVAFAAAAIVFHDKAWDGDSFHRLQVFLAAIFLFLSLISYECAVAVVPILLVFDWFLRPGRLWTPCARFAHPFYWATVFLYVVLRRSAGAVASSGGRWIEATRVQLSLSSPFFTFRHFADWFWPFGRFSVGGSYVWGDVSAAVLAGCAFFGIAVVASAVLFRKRFPALCFCVFFALLGFAPTSNILGFGNGPFCDYYVSLASVGLAAGCVEAVCLLADVRGKWRAPAIALAIAFVLVRVAAVPEASRWARLWSRSELAYAEDVANNPESIQSQLGALRNKMAEENWDEALEIGHRIESKVGSDSPFMKFVYAVRVAHAILIERDKASALVSLGHYASLANDRETEKQVLFYEGTICETLDGDIDAAEQKFAQALEGSQGKELVVGCSKALAGIKSRRGKWDEAVALLEDARRIDPENVSLTWLLAIGYQRIGRTETSMELLNEVRSRTGNPALRIPDNPADGLVTTDDRGGVK